MLDFLYSITIYPFEILLGVILSSLIRVFDSLGASIIALSILVNIALLPVYKIAEQWQAAERLVQQQMNSKLREIKAAYKGYERHALISTLYRQHDYKPVYALKSVFGILIQVPLFFAAYQLLSNYEPLIGAPFTFLSDLSQPDQLLRIGSGQFNLMPFIMFGVNIVAIALFSRGTSFHENRLHYLVATIFLIALYTQASGLILYWTTTNLFSLGKSIISNKLASYSSHTAPANASDCKSSNIASTAYWLGLSLVLILPLISAPLGLLESGSIVDFPENLMHYMKPLLGITIAGVAIGAIVYLILPDKILTLSGFLLTILAYLITINLFGFSGDFGDMSNFVFDEGYGVDIVWEHFNMLTLVIALVALLYFLKTPRKHWVIHGQALVLTAVIALAGYNAYQFVEKRKGLKVITGPEPLFTLSRTGKNVVILMMDRMVGSYIPTAFELDPNLKSRLPGFIWYPKTLSQGTYTVLGVPTITGGYDYLARVTNNDDNQKTLSTLLDESFRVLPYNFTKAGFENNLIQPSSFFDIRNNEYLENARIRHPYNSYHKYWRFRNNVDFSESTIHSKLAHFGLFRIAPLKLREAIYANGSWLPFDVNNNHQMVLRSLLQQGIFSRSTYYGGANSEKNTAALKNWAIMDDLPLLSRTADNIADQFFYFSNELVHEPWATRPDLTLELSEPITFSLQDIQKFKGKTSLQHVYTVAAALKLIADWLDWLKENNVYDNTRIIITSDHGRDVFSPMFNRQHLSGEGSLARKQHQVSWFHSALLVKDFGQKGSFSVSNKFMTTADVPWLALDKIIDGENPYTKNRLAEPTNKIPWVAAYAPWRLEDNEPSNYSIEQYFTVHNEDIFDLSNWSRSKLNEPIPAFFPKYKSID